MPFCVILGNLIICYIIITVLHVFILLNKIKSNQIHNLGWQSRTLDSQRQDQRLVLFYKIINGLTSVEAKDNLDWSKHITTTTTQAGLPTEVRGDSLFLLGTLLCGLRFNCMGPSPEV